MLCNVEEVFKPFGMLDVANSKATIVNVDLDHLGSVRAVLRFETGNVLVAADVAGGRLASGWESAHGAQLCRLAFAADAEVKRRLKPLMGDLYAKNKKASFRNGQLYVSGKPFRNVEAALHALNK